MELFGCEWNAAYLLIFSENVGPFIYYSHLGPLIASLLLGTVVLLNNHRAIANWALFTVTLMFAIYCYFDLILWASPSPEHVIFFWASIVPIELLIYASSLYLVYLFANKQRDISVWNKIAISVFFLPIILLLHTKYNLLGLSPDCDEGAIEGPLIQYLYFVEFLYIIWAAIILIRGYILTKESEHRRQLLFVGIGVLLFLMSFSAGNIVLMLSLETIYDQYKLFGMPIFLAFLTYSIIKYKTFDSKILTSQALVISLGLLTLALQFLQTLLQVQIVAALTFILVCVIGVILVRNVKKEISQREKIEKLARDLESANERLKELDRQKTEFVSIASHQLRAPITAIKGYASLILEKSYGDIPKKMTDPIANIYESSRLMVNTIEDFLNVSRIELGRMNFAMEDFDLVSLARKVVEELAHNAELKELKLSFGTEEGSVLVRADMNKIKQVITNFVDNAIKYTPKGSITVSVSADRVKNKALIQVKDTGMGLDKTTINELFDKFTRARNANQVNTTGTGLGLYVGKQLIQGHNGRVWVESEGEGKGSTFFIELPLLKNAEATM